MGSFCHLLFPKVLIVCCERSTDDSNKSNAFFSATSLESPRLINVSVHALYIGIEPITPIASPTFTLIIALSVAIL